MYKILEKYHENKVTTYISNIISKYLPQPFDIEENNISSEEHEFRTNLLNAIKVKNNIEIDDFNKNDNERIRLLEILSNIIYEYILKNKDTKKFTQILGDKGILKSSLYKITFKKDFDKQINNYGIHKNHIKNAIASYDFVKHFGIDNGFKDSFFLKKIDTEKSNFYLIIFAMRKNDELMIKNAWRFYYDNLKLNSAFDILSHFIDKYAMEMKINNENVSFLFNKEIEGKEVNIKINNPNKKLFAWVTSIHRNKSKINILYAFAIDLDKYKQDLRDNGVRV